MKTSILSSRVAETCLLHSFERVSEKKLVNQFTNSLVNYVRNDYFEANIKKMKALDNIDTNFLKTIFASKEQKVKTKKFKQSIQNEINKYKETNGLSDRKATAFADALITFSDVLPGSTMQEHQIKRIKAVIQHAKDNKLISLDKNEKSDLISRFEVLQVINSKLETVM